MMNASAGILYTTCLNALTILIEQGAPIEAITAMNVSAKHLEIELLGGDISQETIHNAEVELIAANEWLQSQNQQKVQGAA
jgi:hypothetical protein